MKYNFQIAAVVSLLLGSDVLSACDREIKENWGKVAGYSAEYTECLDEDYGRVAYSSHPDHPRAKLVFSYGSRRLSKFSIMFVDSEALDRMVEIHDKYEKRIEELHAKYPPSREWKRDRRESTRSKARHEKLLERNAKKRAKKEKG